MSNIYVSVGGKGSSDGKNLHETSAVSNNSNSSSEDATTAVNCQHPIVKSFHLTQFMVFWIAPLFEIADKRQLLDTDVWSLPPSLSVHSTYDKFWRTDFSIPGLSAVLLQRVYLLWVATAGVHAVPVGSTLPNHRDRKVRRDG